jgi:S1-C subfamily serine protease
LAADEKSTIELFQRMNDSVVSIATASVQLGPGFNAVEVPSGTGTGFMWDSLGHVVTNFHVLEGGERWRVTLADQSTWDAEVVGLAEDRDLAVLKINAPRERLKPVAVGASRDLQVGQRVFAIGCPFGLDQTLTTGIISGLGREIPARNGRLIQGVIQTDAAINPGNSGGPLLDSAGRLIGVNTAIYSPTGTSAGIGFAIPVDMVNRTVPQLLRYGRAVRPVLGVRIAPDAIMSQLGLSGVMIQGVQSNGAAAAAGLQGVATDRSTVTRLGDVIVALNGRKIVRQDDLFEALEQCEFGAQVKLTIVRNATSDESRTLDVDLTLPSEPVATR